MKKNINSKINSKRGSAGPLLLLAMTMLILLSVFWGHLSGLLNPARNLADLNTYHSAAQTAQDFLLGTLNDAQSFKLTTTDPNNPEMQCLNSTTLACPNSGGPFLFKLHNGANEIVNDTGPTSGLTLGGDLCNTFDAVNGSSLCPFQYVLRWQPICPPSGACLSPMVEIFADLTIKIPGEGLQINVAPYKIHIIR